MGTVFLARDVRDAEGALVAVKVLRAELADDEEFLRRFRHEVAVAQRVAGWCTAQVLDARVDGPHPYLVTEYVDGPSLDRLVATRGPLAAAALHGFAAGVAAALAAIHAAGLVHRDLKPANILLASSGPRVIDFGIAQALDHSVRLTQTGVVLGTPGWMAPEQLTTHPLGTPVDVFLWGGLVLYAGAGRKPFGEGALDVVCARILHGEPDLEGLPAPLAGLVAAALAKHPAARPTAAELMQELLGHPADAETALTRTLRRTWAVPDPRAARRGMGGYRGEPASAPAPVRAGEPVSAPAPVRAGEPVSAPAHVRAGAPPRTGEPERPWGPGPSWEPTPPARTAGGWSRGAGVAAALAVVAVLVLTGWLGLREDGSASAAGSPAASPSAEPPGAPAPAVTAAPTADEEDASPAAPPDGVSAAEARGALGAPVGVGPVTFTVTGVACDVERFAAWRTLQRCSGQGHSCLVDVEAVVTGDAPHDLSGVTQLAYDETGAVYEMDGASHQISAKGRLFDDLAPGDRATGRLAFDLPDGRRVVRVELRAFQGGAAALVDLDGAPAATNTAGPGPSTDPVDPAAVPPDVVQDWIDAGANRRCAPLTFTDLGQADGATPRRANGPPTLTFLAFDRPGLPGVLPSGEECPDCGRGVFGFGSLGRRSVELLAEPDLTWADGSIASFSWRGGDVDVTGAGHRSAILRVTGQDCDYQVWSYLGREHLEVLLRGIRVAAVA